MVGRVSSFRISVVFLLVGVMLFSGCCGFTGQNEIVEPPPLDLGTHRECRGGVCEEVDGSGEDECLSDRECFMQTPESWDNPVVCGDGYLSPSEYCDLADDPKASNWSDAKVYDTCPKDMRCRNCTCVPAYHMACNERKCVEFLGGGKDECRKDSECAAQDLMSLCGNGVIENNEECDMAEDSGRPTPCPREDAECISCKCVLRKNCSGAFESPSCDGKCSLTEECKLNNASGCYSCKKKIACSSNSDCGEGSSERLCFNDDVYEQKETPYCSQPGTSQSQCKVRLSGLTAAGQILPPLEDCDPGHCFAGACVGKTNASTTTSTTLSEEVSCEERGMFDSQGDCSSDCNEPDYCEYSESYGCWLCWNVVCGSGMFEDSDCGGCNVAKGEICEEYQDTGCFRCVCPDLIVTSISGRVSKSSQTTCVGESCSTECSLSATIDFAVRNIGKRAAGASKALAEISPGTDSSLEDIEPLAAGATSSIKHAYLSEFGSVSGSGGSACEALGWWSDSYSVSVDADNADQVAECIESNNDKSIDTVEE